MIIAMIGFFIIYIIHRITGLFIPTISIVAAMMIALYGGFYPGFFWVLVFCLVDDFFFIPPDGGGLLENRESFIHYSILFAVAIIVMALASSLRTVVNMRDKEETAKREAQKAVNNRDEMIGVVSHELKNPLTALQTSIALLYRSVSKTSRDGITLKNLEILKSSTQRMSSLISDLLDITRFEANALKLEPLHCDVNEIIRNIVNSYEPSAEDKSIKLIAKSNLQNHKAMCDPARTSQIFANLIGNAIKFTQRGGSVQVLARIVSNFVEVEVSDTGKGIAHEDLPHIFDRFWQSRDTVRGGTGLGLTIVKCLVDAQGGKIWVQSKVGEGTKFFFTLPLAQNKENETLLKKIG